MPAKPSSAAASTTISVRVPRLSRHADIAAALADRGPWLVVAPHDDDAVLGMGMGIASAVAAGIEVHIAVVSDGGMGYTNASDRAGIVARRRAEMIRSSALLGVPAERIHSLGFPDSDLPAWQGCRPQSDGSLSGIARALTAVLRRVRPTRVFGNTAADLHPDHRVVASELDVSCFHASGEIWLELGAPIALPRRFDYAVYTAFPTPPTVEIRGSAALFATKLESIACFASQPQINMLVERIRSLAPLEYLGEVTWRPYDPSRYAELFAPQAARPAAVSRAKSAQPRARTVAARRKES